MVDRNMQIRGGQIKDGTISEAKLDINNAPVDGYILQYNQTAGKLEWVSANEGVTEIPSGTINGVNSSFTLTDAPQSGTLHLYLNGIYQEEGSGNDYLASGTSITFVIAPETDDIVIACYLKSATLGTLGHVQNTDTKLDEGGANEVTAADVKLAVTDKHAHSNKALLDTYTQTEVDIADAISKEHAHSNSAQLDLITDGDHDVSTSNPHSVSKAQVGLTNVDDINATVSNFQFIIDDGSGGITTGIKGQVEIPFDCNVTAAVLIADQSGSIVVDIKKATYAGFPTTASIAASAKPTLSSSQKMQDSTLSGWTVALSAGDIIEYVVDSATTVQRVLVSLMIERT